MKNVAVIGMGTMGPGIAATLARGGMSVSGYDTSAEAVANSGALIDGAFGVLEALGMPDNGGAGQITMYDSLEDCVAGADLVVETVGGRGDATLRQAIDVTRKQGRIVILGGFRVPITLDWLQPLLKEHSILFSSCYSVLDGRHDYEIAIDLMASGKVQLEQMVTHRLPLEEIQKGFDTAYDKSTGSIKVQIHQ